MSPVVLRPLLAGVRNRLLQPVRAALLLGLLAWLAAPQSARAQLPEEKRRQGFTTMVAADASGRELTEQSYLWVLEVRFKPMRMVWVDVTDPQTGDRKREAVWYLVYQAVHRPQERRIDTESQPVNVEDPAPGRPRFVPEFTLVTTDFNKPPKVYHDVILPEAQAAIIARERRPLKNSVEVVGPIPDPTPKDAREEQTIDGVAMFHGVDPTNDRFVLLMTGFSNGYRIEQGPDGEPVITRRTIVQKYLRPGDEFLQHEGEFRLDGDPTWIYRPDAAQAGAVLPEATASEGPIDETAPPQP